MLKKSTMSIPSAGCTIYYFHTILGLMILLGVFISCSANSETMPWWTDPCKQKIPPVLDKLRHGRSADNRGIILNQLNILISGNKAYLSELGKIYRPKDEYKMVGRFKWLNVKKLLREMEASRGYNAKLRKLHNALQLFGGILEKLSQVQLRSHGKFRKDKRDSIIFNTKLRLKAFICAVKEALIYANKKTENIQLKDMNINLPEQTNLTRMYILDINIFKKMKLFLSQVKKRVLRRRRRIRNGRNGKQRNGKKGNDVPLL